MTILTLIRLVKKSSQRYPTTVLLLLLSLDRSDYFPLVLTAPEL